MPEDREMHLKQWVDNNVIKFTNNNHQNQLKILTVLDIFRLIKSFFLPKRSIYRIPPIIPRVGLLKMMRY